MHRRPVRMRLATMSVLSMIFVASHAWPDDKYSQTELTQLSSVKASSNGACAEFEATFSGPLKKAPKATLDVDNHHTILGVFKAIVSVASNGAQRLRMYVMDKEMCKKMKNAEGNVSVTFEGGLGSDGNPIIPDGRTFSTSEVKTSD